MKIEVGGRRCGKSDALARVTAALLKAGHVVYHGGTGERIVGVIGYDDTPDEPEPPVWLGRCGPPPPLS